MNEKQKDVAYISAKAILGTILNLGTAATELL
jgi:hypothetical protein